MPPGFHREAVFSDFRGKATPLAQELTPRSLDFDIGSGGITPVARLDLTFNSAVQGFGAQFHSFFNSAWTMHVQAFDSEDNLLGLFDRAMKRSNGFAGDKAQFVGVRSDSANISRIEIWATAIYCTGDGPAIAPNSFALNFGRLVLSAPGASLLALAVGVLAIGRSRRIG